MKKELALLACMGICAAANASEPVKTQKDEALKVDIGGSLDTFAGFTKQKGGFHKNNYNGEALNKGAIMNDTKLKFNANGKFANGNSYGAVIEIYADSSSSVPVNPESQTPQSTQVGKKAFMFGESQFGKLEVGGGDSATKQLQVSANNIARGPGGINGRAQKLISQFTYLDAPGLTFMDRQFFNHFVKWPTLPFDCDCTSNSGKVTYYTPKFNGFQWGISIVPDSDMSGTTAKLHKVATNDNAFYKKIFNSGLKYEGKFGDIEFQAALTGEVGKAKRNDPALARNDLEAWEFGSMVKYKGFSVAGSYSDWRKTGTPKIKEAGRKYGASYWTAGAGYEQDKFGVSVTYFNSKRANVYNGKIIAAGARDTGYNKFELLSFGVDYKLAPGFMPYAEVNAFKTKQPTASRNNKGNVVILGSKLNF